MHINDFLLKLSHKAVKKKILPMSLLRVQVKNKQERIFNKIKYYFDHEIKDTTDFEKTSDNEKIIWVLWYQGLNCAPDVVKSCIASIIKQNPDYKVIVLTDDNVWNFYNAPSYVKDKVLSGIITKTHFSDILRFYLLKTYGGVWIDSTVYMTKPLLPWFSIHPFATLKDNGTNVDLLSISEGKWSGYIISSAKGGYLVTMLNSFFERYWEKEERLVDYFLIDYAIKFLYLNFQSIREVINLGAIDGSNRFFLAKNINNPYTDEIRYLISTDELGMYKLNYKFEFHLLDKFGCKTIYKNILDDSIIR